MNKVYVLPAGEDWIVDRLSKEWQEDNIDISVSDPREADVIWLLASWCWRKLPIELLRQKKVLATIHHVVPNKFGRERQNDFLERDSIVTEYHVYNQETYNFIRPLTSKPINLIQYWANQKTWKATENKESIRARYNLPKDSYLIGSFQRDTEGNDLSSPKLEKGPDLFIDFVKKLKQDPNWNDRNFRDIHVVLAGWRRQYVISKLNECLIPYTYFEKPSQVVVNDLYQSLDVYPVTSRHEGGPQALIECGLLNVPVLSRKVGIADQLLHPNSIKNDVYDAIPSIPNVEHMKLPSGYIQYRLKIEEML